MTKNPLKFRLRGFPFAFLLAISCGAAVTRPQESAGPDRADWPKAFDARESRIVVYEPQLETFKGSRLITRAAVSVTRPDAAEPVFGAIWLDAVLTTDAGRRTATPVVIKVRELRFPGLSPDEAARLKQDIGEEIPRWNLVYSVDDLLAQLRLLEEQKALAQGLKAEVPQILFRSNPAVLLPVQDEPAWRTAAGTSLERLENSPAFVVRDPSTGTCYLRLEPFWWSATDPLGAWLAADAVPEAVAALWKSGSKPQAPAAGVGQDAPPRPEVIPVKGPSELVCTDGPPQFAPLAGTDLLYIRNTESDVFLEIQTQVTYALFSGRWYRTPSTKTAWEFVPSDQLPADFSRIPLTSEKQHVLACVAGTPQAREAVRNSEIPQTEAVKPGPAPDLAATYDGEPQFTDIGDTSVQYAVNTPYSIFCADRRYYWCLDGIWYDAAFALGPWFVCASVPRSIYLIPPSCPHYYVTYCHVFSATPDAIYVGYYPGYRGCYVWGGTVVFGTGWHYRPWYGNRCYTRPVTWGVGVRYNPVNCGWSVGHSYGGRGSTVQVGVGGSWGGTPVYSPGVHNYRGAPSSTRGDRTPDQNLYSHHPERLAPSPAHPPGRPPPPDRETPRTPPVSRKPVEHQRDPAPDRESPRTPPTTTREPHETPRTPPPADREAPRTPPPPPRKPIEHPRDPAPSQENPRTPPPSREPRDNPRTPPADREIPRTPPPRREPHEAPKPPPQADREAPRTPPPPREPREAPRTPPPPRENRDVPKAPPPPPKRETPKEPPRQQDHRRAALDGSRINGRG